MDGDKKGLPKSQSGFSGNQTGQWMRYSGMAMQMLGTILAFTYGGYWLDGRMGNKTPVWTLILSLVSIAASLYLLIRSFTKK